MKKIKPRKDSYWGLHFDLHANETDTELGKNLNEAVVEKVIQAARPDYLQYDSKGHCGYLAYPHSNVSTSAGGPDSKGIVKDSLAIYRKVTRRHGVGLYMHFSGVFDILACKEHPEWACRDEKRELRTVGAMSTFGPYLQERMLPQMKELIDRYQVDGFWIDGDSWAAWMDYCPEAEARFRERTGLETVPTKPGEPGWLEWGRVQREQFQHYVRTYCDVLHAYAPGISICSNWFLSRMSPSPASVAPVDFISGDYGWFGSVLVGRFEARHMASVGKPWDLMLWGWLGVAGAGAIFKPTHQLMQEGAVTLAQGGGLEIYFQPDRDGDFAQAQLDTMRQVGKFARERKAFCFRTETVPQVAFLTDTQSLWSKSASVYSTWGGEYRAYMGALLTCIRAGHSVDIVCDHQLEERLERYAVLVVPEWEEPSDETVARIEAFVRNGGSLWLTGAKTARRFGAMAGVNWVGEPEADSATVHWTTPGKGGDAMITTLTGLWQRFTPRQGTRVLARRTRKLCEKRDPQPVLSIARYGKGRVACFAGPFGMGAYLSHPPVLREIARAVLAELYTPLVELEPGDYGQLELVVRQKHGDLIVHLLNANNMAVAECSTGQDGNALTCAGNTVLVDSIPAVGPITLTVRLPEKPRGVRLEPEGIPLKVAPRKPGVYAITVPRLTIHSAVILPGMAKRLDA